jgi:2-succinyl-6-hydroxy-2,4-cyclohexadiene-1-carboxylate synthase
MGQRLQSVKSNMNSNFIYALHGFLGQGTDWTQSFSNWDSCNQIVCPSYFSDPGFTDLSVNQFYKNMNDSIVEKFKRKVFVGYSLGGRIGLQLLDLHPEAFDHYVFISVHSGFSDEAQKAVRLKSDQTWIDYIQHKSWLEFEGAWNQQEVLKGTKTVPRLEGNYDKKRLAMSLSAHSLGRQKDYSGLIQKYQHKISWIIGDQDTKFLNLAEELKQKKILLDYKRISSGHRILFDNPVDLQIELKKIF